MNASNSIALGQGSSSSSRAADPPYGSPSPTAKQGIGELLGALARDTGTLVRQEVRLATSEVGEKAKRVAHQSGLLIAGGAMIHAGALLMLLSAVYALREVMPVWASALMIGALVAGIGWSMLSRSMKALAQLDPVPRKTVETLRAGAAEVVERVTE